MPIAQSPFESNPAPMPANNARFDGAIENALTGDGDPKYDKSVYNQPGQATRLTYQQKEDLYEGSWLCRRICDAYPSEGTREWTELTLGSTGKQKMLADFQKYEEKLAPAEAFNQAQTWANIYRGAAIVLHVDDGQDYANPINRDKINSIVEIEVLDPLDIRPNISEGFNPLKPDYYELTGVKTLSMQSQKQLINTGVPRFHPDRVIRFDGFNLPARSMRRNENWGGSILDNIWMAFSRYESGNNAITAMLSDYNVFVYALKGLSNLIASSDDKSLVTLRNRLRTLQMTMSNMKGLVIDADGEKAEFVSRNLSGVSEVIAHLKDDLIGASGLPHTAVFGDSAGGLGSTGESEEATWAKMVNQFQEKSFRKKVRYLYELMWLAKDGPSKGKIPDDWNFTFKPLTQESEETKIANRSSQSQTDNTYVSMGVLLKEEVRQSRFGGSEFSFETTLDKAAWDKAQAAEQFDPSQFSMGDDPNADPNADPYADPNAPPPDGTDPNAPPPGGGVDPNAAPTEEPEPEPDAKKKKVKQDREDSTNPHRSGFVFVPELGDRESYWRRDPRRRRQAIELPHGGHSRLVPTHPQILEGGDLRFSGLNRSEMEALDDISPPPLSFAGQLSAALITSKNLRPILERRSWAGLGDSRHLETVVNSWDMLKLLNEFSSMSQGDKEEKAGFRMLKTHDGIIQSFAHVSVVKAPVTRGTVLSVDILAVAPHNLSMNGIWEPAIREMGDEAEMRRQLQYRRTGTSSAMLEALIKESKALGLKGRISCRPLGLNRPLFAKAGFRFRGEAKGIPDGDFAYMELSADRAQKFLEMRSRTQQRHDADDKADLKAALQWQKELNEMEEDLGGFMAGPNPIAPPPTKPKAKQKKQDSVEPRKRVSTIAGLNLDITHDPGDDRHGRTMTMGYGRVRGSYGHAEDGKSWDVFVGPNDQSDKAFKIRQIDPKTLIHDETKYVVGCDSIEQARDLGLIQMGADRFGGIEPVKHAELSSYRKDCSESCGCAVKQKPKPRFGELGQVEGDETLALSSQSGDKSATGLARSRSKGTRKAKARTETLDEESDREDAQPGKKCGEGWISSRKECRVGEHGFHHLSPFEFDQDLKKGWRSLETLGEQEKALTDYQQKYIGADGKWKQSIPMDAKQRALPPEISHWHLGQVYAMQNKNSAAIEQMKKSRSEDSPEWNDYADLSILYLENDRKGFEAKYQSVPKDNENRSTIERLYKGLKEKSSYSQAYNADSSEIPAHPEIKEDSRRIWVDNPKVEHGGFWRTDPRSKAEPRSPAKSFVSHQELRQLKRVPGRDGPRSLHTTYEVEAPDGTRSIYKIAPENDLDSAATEILCSDLAASVGVRANTTRLVPSALAAPFDLGNQGAGTLHSMVPGAPMVEYVQNAQGFAYRDVKLKLSMWNDAESEEAILGMTRHPDLARMVALDLFTGNGDRHLGNFFYDRHKDQFHAIDMGSGYETNTSEAFAKVASGLSQDFKKMSPKEQGNVRVFADTLHRLNAENSVPALQARLTHLTVAASSRSGFASGFQRNQTDIETYNRLRQESFVKAQEHLNQTRAAMSSTTQLHLRTQESLSNRLHNIRYSRAGINKVLQIFSPYL